MSLLDDTGLENDILRHSELLVQEDAGDAPWVARVLLLVEDDRALGELVGSARPSAKRLLKRLEVRRDH